MKYTVSIYYTASVDYEVEADSPEQAEQKAREIDEPIETFYPKILDNLEFSDAMVTAWQ